MFREDIFKEIVLDLIFVKMEGRSYLGMKENSILSRRFDNGKSSEVGMVFRERRVLWLELCIEGWGGREVVGEFVEIRMDKILMLR